MQVIKGGSVNQNMIVTGTSSSTIQFIDPRVGSFVQDWRASLLYSNSSIKMVAVDEAGYSIAVGFASGIISLFDSRTGLLLSSWKAHENEIIQLKFYNGQVSSSLNFGMNQGVGGSYYGEGSDGQPMFSQGSMGFDFGMGGMVNQNASGGSIWKSLLFSSSADNQISLWDLNTTLLQGTCKTPTDIITMSMSKDRLFSIGANNTFMFPAFDLSKPSPPEVMKLKHNSLKNQISAMSTLVLIHLFLFVCVFVIIHLFCYPLV